MDRNSFNYWIEKALKLGRSSVEFDSVDSKFPGFFGFRNGGVIHG